MLFFPENYTKLSNIFNEKLPHFVLVSSLFYAIFGLFSGDSLIDLRLIENPLC
jgi:hypothetical protein